MAAKAKTYGTAATPDDGDSRNGLGAVALVASMVGVIIALVTRAQRD